MDVLLGMTGLIGVIVCVIVLIVLAIRKKPKKKAVVVLIAFSALFWIGMAISFSKEETVTKAEYDELVSELKSVNLKLSQKSEEYDALLEEYTELQENAASFMQLTEDEQAAELAWAEQERIEAKQAAQEEADKIAAEKAVEEEAQRQAEEQQQAQAQKEQDQQQRDAAAALFHEIRMAYKNNELSADDTYKGNRYTIVGSFDGISEDGLLNQLLGEIKVTLKIVDEGTPCYLFCDFDADTWREELSKLSKGDEMVIEGECDSWGVWSDCELLN